jgi:tetratricopeptide (TPR) repeat protein
MAVFLGAHITSGIKGIKKVVRSKMQRRGASSSNELALLIGVEAVVAALLVHSVMDFNLHIPANTLFVAFLFGILANPTSGESSKTETNAAPGAPLWLRLTPAALGAVLIAICIPRIPAEYNAERARVALRDSSYTQAAAFAHESLARDIQNPDVYLYLGESQHFLALLAEREHPEIAQQDRMNAIEAYKGGLNVFPDDLRLQLKLARTYDLMHRFDDAETVLQRALAFDPNFGNVYAYYGLHLHLQQKFKRAESYYRKALSLNETELSPQGLKDIERDRKMAAANDVFSDFVTNHDDEEDDDADTKPVAAPTNL